MLYFKILCSYNPLERREASKGVKEATKKSTQSQPSKGSGPAPKVQSNNNARRHVDPSANLTNQSAKTSRVVPFASSAYDQQVLQVRSCQVIWLISGNDYKNYAADNRVEAISG